jgi:hypothetical protein
MTWAIMSAECLLMKAQSCAAPNKCYLVFSSSALAKPVSLCINWAHLKVPFISVNAQCTVIRPQF